MITIEGISKTFGKQKVLDNISIDMKRGECIALIGPNGSGKTTLIKAILRLVLPDEGRIAVNGQTVRNHVEYRSHIGYMPQMSRLPENMNVRRLFLMIKNLRKDVDPKNYDTEIYRDFQIDSMAKKPMGKLSGGMKQKVSAALAFLFDPDILILDEPTASLDPVSSERLKEKIATGVEKGKLVIITSHNLSDLEGLVSRVVYLMDGRVHFDRSLEELQEQTGATRLNRMIVEMLEKPQTEKPQTVL